MRAPESPSPRSHFVTYELGFLASALKEWRKLDAHTRDQFKKKLAERLDHPHVPASKLSGANNRYKIKLRNIGYRLVYEVHDTEVIVLVVAVGRRDRNAVYKAAEKRTDTAATVMTSSHETREDDRAADLTFSDRKRDDPRRRAS